MLLRIHWLLILLLGFRRNARNPARRLIRVFRPVNMWAFLLSRFLSAAFVVCGVATLVFGLVHVIPGDPVEVMLGETATSADRDVLRRALGLDKPITTQFATYVSGLAVGDLGESIQKGRPVAELIEERWPHTFKLALAGGLLAVLLAVPLGVMAAVHRGTWWDALSTGIATVGLSIPNFVLGPVLILVFSLWLGLLPISGDETASSIVLPSIALGTSMAALLTRMIRASLLEVINEDYMRTAIAKGLSPLSAVLRHGLRNACLPLLTILGLQLGTLLGGAVITEIVFSWPGIGQLTIEAISQRDYPVLQGCVLLISTSYVLVTTATDIMYGVVDPRVSFDA